MPRKTPTAIKTTVHSWPSIADTPLEPRVLPFVGVSGCSVGGILELSVCVGVAVAVAVAVTVVIFLRIAVGVAAGVAVAVASGAISVPGSIQREVSSCRPSLHIIRLR